MINIGSIGYNHTHKKDFCADNPNGPGAWLFLLIKTGAIMTLDKKKYDVRPGTIVIISPKTPCSYKPKKDIYTDDWFYFDDIGSDDIAELKELSIEINKPLYVGNYTEISGLLYTLTTEFYSANLYRSTLVELYTRILFRIISRSLICGTSSEGRISTDKKETIHYIRAWIYREPESIPFVEIISERFGMSLSSLEHTYKKTFGISIKQDIINSRINCAKHLLQSTTLTVAQIAEKTGYISCYGFMRQFKNSVGVTPTEFRKYQAVGK